MGVEDSEDEELCSSDEEFADEELCGSDGEYSSDEEWLRGPGWVCRCAGGCRPAELRCAARISFDATISMRAALHVDGSSTR